MRENKGKTGICYFSLLTKKKPFAPEVILLSGYSGFWEESVSRKLTRQISDNIDRFFFIEYNHLSQGAIDICKDFDKEKLKQSYFKQMDFISHF